MRELLRDDLRRAIKAQDRHAIRVLSTTLGAIDNAEAVHVTGGRLSVSESKHVAAAVAGTYSADVPRRELSEAEVASIVRHEIEERQAAAADFERLGRVKEASRLVREAELLRTYLT